MVHFLANKRIIVGVSGGIAAYKSAELVRRLRECGAIVKVVMTANAKRFISPLTMQALSGLSVADELFDLQAEAAMGHIELARWAELILVAPASANFMAAMAHGFANDLLTTLCLATEAPIAIAPAMNQGMWKNKITQSNAQILTANNITLLGPGIGIQACGDHGLGRMLEPHEIINRLSQFFTQPVLSGVRVLITAGPTHEAIDPVRYIANGSSGKMGYALAQAASLAGAAVVLISGPVALAKPSGVDVISVVSAFEMYAAVMRNVMNCDIFLSVAAVADYRVQQIAAQKIHKDAATLQLSLVKNPDIVASVGQLAEKPYIVGFAAETENVISRAKEKRLRKKMDLIIANQVGDNKGMNSDVNEVTLISATDEVTLPQTTKNQLAIQLISLIADHFKGSQHDRISQSSQCSK